MDWNFSYSQKHIAINVIAIAITLHVWATKQDDIDVLAYRLSHVGKYDLAFSFQFLCDTLPTLEVLAQVLYLQH